MKILVVGDFHGKFPKKLKDRIKKEKINLVVSLGDYVDFILRKEFFKYCYRKGIDLWEVIGKKRYRSNIVLGDKRGKKIVSQLNKLKIPVVSVLGNSDYPLNDDVDDVRKPKGKRYWKWDWERAKKFENFIKKHKNIHHISYSSFAFNDIIFIGMRGHSYPGKVKSKSFKRHRRKLDKLFKKYKDKKIIFVSYIVPYDTKMDKVKDKDAPRQVIGKHIGSKLTRRVIDKWKPFLNLSGHFHEHQGRDRLGKTVIINPGPAYEGKAAIVNIGKDKIKNVKFLR